MYARATAAGLLSILAFGILACGAPRAARATDDPATARLREMLHRTQEALRQAQSDNADLMRTKTEVEQKLQAATKELAAARGVSKAEVALRGELVTTKTAEENLARKFGDAAERLAASNAKLNEATRQLVARDAELAQAKQGLEQSKTQDAICENKNLKLYSYAQEVLRAYRNKGVWAALAQKDPVFGVKDVEVQNVVQEYRLKMADQKVKSSGP